MRTTVSWRCVSVWLFVAPLCWVSLYHHVGCKETHTQAGSAGPPPTQDLIKDQEPEERSTVQKVGESWAAVGRSVGGYVLLGDKQNTHRHTEEQRGADEGIISKDQEVKEPSSAVRAQPDTTSPETVIGSGAEPEDPPLETAVTEDQEEFEQPPSSPGVLPDVFIEYDPKASPPTPSRERISEPKASELPEPEQNVPDLLYPTDCDPADSNPYQDASPPIVMENTSNTYPAGTKTRAEPSPGSEPDPTTRHPGANTSHTLQGKGLGPPASADPETDSAVGVKDPEDIPTFDEWKRKMLEVEREQIEATPTPAKGGAGGHTVKKVPKNFNNYASVECGAKILGANPEAKSTSDILKENMDLYMLNPCSNKIWFIIELCEPIQVTQLDIANFELFSSTPKDFLVSISNRYPTNKWLKLGTFHGRDERTVQSFPLDEHLYAKYVKIFTKYIKVELVSHFGSEHFCPLSLIRVFGTSMVEEYEENTDPHDRTEDQDFDLDYLPGYASGELKSSSDLIGSAKEVLNMVTDFAVNVLSGGNASVQELNSTEPRDPKTPDLTPSFLPGREAAGLEIPADSGTPLEEGCPSPVGTHSPEELPSAADPPSQDRTPSPPGPTHPTIPPAAEEEHVVTPLPHEDEEPIGRTIVLLEEEEEGEEERKLRETSVYCAFSTSLSSSSFSSRSCVASLQEHLLQQCSTAMYRLRRRQTPGVPLTLFPPPPPYLHYIRSDPPAWELTVPTSACPAQIPPPTPASGTHVNPPPPPEPSGEGGLPRVGGGEPSGNGTSGATGPLERGAAGLAGPQPPDVLEPSRTSTSPTSDAPTTSRPTPPPPAPAPAPTAGGTQPPGAAQGGRVHKEKEEKDDPPQSVAAVPLSPIADDLRDLQFPVLAEEEAPPPEKPQDPSLTLSLADMDPREEEFPSDTPFPLSSGGCDGGGGSAAGGSGDGGGDGGDGASEGGSDGGGAGSDGEQTPPSAGDSSPAPQTSGQKESVFMRLSNRIKSLEMNMSLSGRYLEQLSQRYRKQMEEMQRAFNKTVLKLQNTSRLAEEQEQRQTDSIEALGGQLENITHLVLNLAVRVSMLQREVSDRQSYLLVCLLLCALLGTVVVANHFSASSAPLQPPSLALWPPPPPPPRLLPRPAQGPESSTLSRIQSSYCCSERESVCSDIVTRRASYPLLRCDSLKLAAAEEPGTVCTQDSPDKCTLTPQKRRRVSVPGGVVVEDESTWALGAPVRPSVPSPSPPTNGALRSGTLSGPRPVRTLGPAFIDSRSEGSSEGSSSHSDEPSFCGAAAGICPRGLCPGLDPLPPHAAAAAPHCPPSSSSSASSSGRAGKQGWRRRRSKPVCSVVDLMRAHPPLPPHGTVTGIQHLPGVPLQDLASHGDNRTHTK